MAQIDFYLLDGLSLDSVACKLLDKVYQGKLTAHVHCDTEEQAKALDDTLWTFKDTSFIPHARVSDTQDTQPPISIAFGDQMPPAIYDVLLTECVELPEFASQFERILYLFPGNNDQWKTVAREYFKEFKELGWTVNFHQI